jgi:hypothetical protein
MRPDTSAHATAFVPPPDPGLQPAQHVVWQAIRHLFPPHARARQGSSGSLAISWALEDDPSRSAVPVVIQLEEEYLRVLREAPSPRRAELAAAADQTVRAGMRGYDPYARIPRSRVIVVG